MYYFGEIGDNGRTVIDYFTKHGVAVGHDTNVADLLIEVAGREAHNAVQDWCDVWEKSDEAVAVLDTITSITTPDVGSAARQHEPSPDLNNEFASTTVQQIIVLTKRTFLQYWRTPDYIYSRLYCCCIHALLNGLMYLQLGNTEADMQYRIFANFLVLMIVPEFINACAMMLDDNRNVWLGREHPSRIYGWVAFTSASIVVEIPFAFVGAVVFYLLFYFPVGFSLGTPAGYAFLMMLLFHLFSTSWGQWIAALR